MNSEESQNQDSEVLEGEIYSSPIQPTKNGREILYSPSQISSEAGIDTNMLRFYAEQFSEFLHIKKTDKGHRRYIAADIPTFIRIRELCKDKRMTVSEAKVVLRKEEYGILIEPEHEESTELVALEKQNATLKKLLLLYQEEHEELHTYMAAFKEEQEKTAKSMALVESLQTEIKELRQEVSKQMSEIQENTKKKHWFRKK